MGENYNRSLLIIASTRINDMGSVILNLVIALLSIGITDLNKSELETNDHLFVVNTWLPAGGSGNWHDGSNWSMGILPNSSHDVGFGLNPGICNILTNAEANSV